MFLLYKTSWQILKLQSQGVLLRTNIQIILSTTDYACTYLLCKGSSQCFEHLSNYVLFVSELVVDSRAFENVHTFDSPFNGCSLSIFRSCVQNEFQWDNPRMIRGWNTAIASTHIGGKASYSNVKWWYMKQVAYIWSQEPNALTFADTIVAFHIEVQIMIGIWFIRQIPFIKNRVPIYKGMITGEELVELCNYKMAK